jgi:hypothetical protein
MLGKKTLKEIFPELLLDLFTSTSKIKKIKLKNTVS